MLKISTIKHLSIAQKVTQYVLLLFQICLSNFLFLDRQTVLATECFIRISYIMAIVLFEQIDLFYDYKLTGKNSQS